jgi:hypothetical protein
MPGYVSSVDLSLTGRQLHCVSSTGSTLEKNGGVVQFTLNEVLQPAQDQIVSRIGVQSFTMPNVMPNFTEKNNIVEVYVTNNTTGVTTHYTDITIPQGFYSTTDILSKINSLFTEENVTLTLTYDAVSNRYTLRSTDTDYTFLLGNTTNRSPWFSTKFQFPVLTSATDSTESSYSINMQTTTSIFLGMTSLPRQSITSHETFPTIIARIPVTVGFGSVMHYEPTEIFYLEGRNIVLSQFVISLFSDAGEVLELDGGGYTLTFLVDYAFQMEPTKRATDAFTNELYHNNPYGHDRLLRRGDAFTDRRFR